MKKLAPIEMYRLTSILFGLALCVGVGCGNDSTEGSGGALEEKKARDAAEADAKDAIESNRNRAIEAVFGNDEAAFKALCDADSRGNEGKVKGAFVAIKLIVGLGQLQKDDFRIDETVFNEGLTQATVNTSHRVGGEWKKDDKPSIWINEGSSWVMKL